MKLKFKIGDNQKYLLLTGFLLLAIIFISNIKLGGLFTLFDTEGSEQSAASIRTSSEEADIKELLGTKLSVATYKNTYKVKTEVQPSDFSTLQTIRDYKHDVNPYENNSITRYNSQAVRSQYGVDSTSKNCYKSGKIIEDPSTIRIYKPNNDYKTYIFSEDFKTYRSEAVGKRSPMPIELYNDEAETSCENLNRQMNDSTPVFGDFGRLYFETKTIDGKKEIHDIESKTTYQLLLKSEHQSGGRYILKLIGGASKYIPKYANIDEKSGMKIDSSRNICNGLVASISGSQVSSSPFFVDSSDHCIAVFELRPPGVGEYRYLINLSSQERNALFSGGLRVWDLGWYKD